MRSNDEDELVERLVRLLREDGGSEALQSTARSAHLSDPNDLEKLVAICAELETESPSSGFVVRVGEASPVPETEARRLVEEWLDRPDAAFGYQRPREYLNCAERRKYFDTFVASLQGDIFA